jgi:tetratricopeptide (TPR) repeat protein
MIPGAAGSAVYLADTPCQHVIDAETLREVPTHPLTLADRVAAACRERVPPDAVAERRHRTGLGVAAWLAGELELAEHELVRAAELAALESPAVALRARVRLAYVRHRRGDHLDAITELDACVADAATQADRAFAHQHAGTCAYDLGDVDRATAHFQAALRLRVAAGAERTLVEASRLALDAADACRTAIAMAEQLHRLVPAGHARARASMASADLPRPRHFGVLIELRVPLPAGPVATPVLAGLFRYQPGIDDAVADLVADGWLTRSANAVAATPKCLSLLENVVAVLGAVLAEAWGSPDEALARMDAVVRGAIGTSAGPVFDALATVDPSGRGAARLFERCNALRHHRADAHAAAWRAAGLTATSVGDAPSAVRRDVETATNRVAARAYRPLSTVERAERGALLGRLDGQPPVLP